MIPRIFYTVPLLLIAAPSLVFGLTAELKREPYLQMGTDTSMMLRWRTDSATESVVKYGASAETLTQEVRSAESTTEHSIRLTNLTPNTRYYYSVGTDSGILAGGDSSHQFRTNPVPGTAKRSRFWVIGDSGTPLTATVRDSYYDFAAGSDTDLWLMLGDNAYPEGRDIEYQLSVFNPYRRLLATSVLWSTIGNHDAKSADSTGETGPYYDIFDFPRNGEAGGLASGTEAYYSFDYGDVHFVCLNSEDIDRSANGAMAQWVTADLAQTTQPWVIAFWHHPPYSAGSHNSDEDGALIQMRENIVPIMEDFGVDLVLSGHSHAYERSFLLDRHYGYSDSLDPTMILDAGDGRPEGDGAYAKGSIGMSGHQGAVYMVAGHSGVIDFDGDLDHPAMYVGIRRMGSVVLDVIDNVLEMTMIDRQGQVQDTFTLLKGGNVVPSAPQNVLAQATQSGVNITWQDTSNNETGFVVERSPDGNNWAILTTLSQGTSAYTDGTASAADGFTYRIQARNQQGGSALIRSEYIDPLESGCVTKLGGLTWRNAQEISADEPEKGTLFVGYFMGVMGVLLYRRKRS